MTDVSLPRQREGLGTRLRRSKRLGRGRVRPAPYLLIAPFFVVFAVFQLFAIGFSFFLSFTDWRGVTGGNVVGFENYSDLAHDASFQRALVHTAEIWLLTVPVLSFGSLALAWIVQSRLVGFKSTIRTGLFLPVVPSIVVSAMTILLLIDPTYGSINLLLGQVGLGPINIRAQAGAAIPVTAFVVVWRWFGYNVVIHAAGLQSMPAQVLEAARIDGANAWQTFWRVVVPLSKPMIVYTMIASTIGIFNMFDEPYVLFGTQGGPGESGLLPATLLYRVAFQDFDLGYASAIAYALAVAIAVFTYIQLRIARRGEHD